jgi:hypothetical protein
MAAGVSGREMIRDLEASGRVKVPDMRLSETLTFRQGARPGTRGNWPGATQVGFRLEGMALAKRRHGCSFVFL